MKYQLGQILKDPYGFTGKVDAIYADYQAAINSQVVSLGWFAAQEKPPSTRDQIFYSLAGSDGAVLVGENEARER